MQRDHPKCQWYGVKFDPSCARIAAVTTAVAHGELSQKIEKQARGDFFQLSLFAGIKKFPCTCRNAGKCPIFRWDNPSHPLLRATLL
jgi:hypothetical protein